MIYKKLYYTKLSTVSQKDICLELNISKRTYIRDRQYLKDIIHLLHDDLLILSKNHQLKLTNDENVIEII